MMDDKKNVHQPDRSLPIRCQSMKITTVDTDDAPITLYGLIKELQQPHALPSRIRSTSFSDGFFDAGNSNNTGTNWIEELSSSSSSLTGNPSMISTTPTKQQQPQQQQHYYDPTIAMMRLSMVGDVTMGHNNNNNNSSSNNNNNSTDPFHHSHTNNNNHINNNNNHEESVPPRIQMGNNNGINHTFSTTNRHTDDMTNTDENDQLTTEEEYIKLLPSNNNDNNNNNTATSMLPSSIQRSTTTIDIMLQIPAIILMGLFHLMIGIPFGVSYFPIGWRSNMTDTDTDSTTTTTTTTMTTTDNNDYDDGIRGTFPLPDKEALGIRMFLFSTIIGQVIFTLYSGFDSPIGLQMVENVPFGHALSKIVISHQGYGIQSLSTILVVFGLSSILVGIVFYLLGRLKLGRIVYYFPNHVLVGCIGGIGIYIAKTGCEVTIDSVISWRSIIGKIHLLVPLLFFEILLRTLQRLLVDSNGKAMFSLLSPIYFCMITPMFYAMIWICQIDMHYVNNSGFFFPSLLDSNSPSPVFGPSLLDMWTIIDFKHISWAAIWDAIPTMIALTLFSLIHVPINIPAYAVSTNTVVDMNKELVAHGYSNIISGLCGGLQNYFAYTQSVLYHRSGGRGRLSGIAVAACTAVLFVFGPLVTSYIPRCMAGTLLLHVGIDLFVEGVYDSIGKFDYVEYAGIWLITIVMTTRGMEAAMIAGGIAAVSTHAVQSVHYVNPIRGSMTASTLRSSRWNRTNEQLRILDDDFIGRSRILVIQLQGHLFFGNMAQFMESVNRQFTEKTTVGTIPWVVLLDFSLVLGIDSSAAQTMTKLSNNLRKSFGTDLCIFVSGSEMGFPCEFDLSRELMSCNDDDTIPDESTILLKQSNGTTGNKKSFRGNRIEESLDLALAFAEDSLLNRQGIPTSIGQAMDLPSDEQELASHQIANISPAAVDMTTIKLLLSYFQRETYNNNDVIWNQGSPSDSMKLLVKGQLIALLENEAGTKEIVHSGNMVGELGLLQGLPRMSSLQCYSENATLYSLSRESFELLCQCDPDAARLVDMICIRYLSNRVQHVSNRIFETRCLPI